MTVVTYNLSSYAHFLTCLDLSKMWITFRISSIIMYVMSSYVALLLQCSNQNTERCDSGLYLYNAVAKTNCSATTNHNV